MGKDQAMLGLAIAFAIAACSNQVTITPEPTGTTSKSTSVETKTTSHTVGSSSSSSGTVTTGSSSSGGTGGATTSSGGPPVAKAVTADNDMAQYQSIQVPVGSTGGVKIVDGPFFVTDAYFGQAQTLLLTTVTAGDCSPSAQHTWALAVSSIGNNVPAQVHGIRFPVPPGQTLCVGPSSTIGSPLDVRGFRPY
jgi:hypothetical protein